MKVSELMGVLHGPDPDADVVACLKVPDGDGGYLPLMESSTSYAEPYPSDDGRSLVHAAFTPAELASQACDPSVVRELAKALEREADRMELAATDPDEEYGIW